MPDTKKAVKDNQDDLKSIDDYLDEALEEMIMDPLIRETLGDHVFNKYATAKRLEFDQYRVQVHQWEVDKYLTQY